MKLKNDEKICFTLRFQETYLTLILHKVTEFLLLHYIFLTSFFLVEKCIVTWYANFTIHKHSTEMLFLQDCTLVIDHRRRRNKIY